ncbi:hypothetical protein [Actinoplanes sp. NPDC049599]|uniref:hypothetical protein n=1 Tax=Actinoplanes sp. NPDC049599 TaxID=3363903 RepID=UPI0037BB23C7
MGEAGENESVGTVVVAGLTNLAIATAKLVAGLLSASSPRCSPSPAAPASRSTTA